MIAALGDARRERPVRTSATSVVAEGAAMAVTYRIGKPSDGPALWEVSGRALLDFGQRFNVVIFVDVEPGGLARLWPRMQPIYDHLATTADEWWVAEADGQVVGYARSTVRDDLRQLTEFFVV